MEAADTAGAARWISVGQPQTYELVDAQRRVLLGAEPAVAAVSAGGRAAAGWFAMST